MNKTTNDLIQMLAEKLGTTATHLWQVLIHQAPISSTNSIIQIICLLIISIIFYKIVRRLYKLSDSSDSDFDWDDNVGVAVVCAAFAIVLLVVWIIYFFKINDIINGYVNPEYWALDHILDALTPKK